MKFETREVKEATKEQILKDDWLSKGNLGPVWLIMWNHYRNMFIIEWNGNGYYFLFKFNRVFWLHNFLLVLMAYKHPCVILTCICCIRILPITN